MPGIDTSFSIRSAKTLKAKAFALAPACNGVTPYASTPGISGISAIHRPSSSCSLDKMCLVHEPEKAYTAEKSPKTEYARSLKMN